MEILRRNHPVSVRLRTSIGTENRACAHIIQTRVLSGRLSTNNYTCVHTRYNNTAFGAPRGRGVHEFFPDATPGV